MRTKIIAGNWKMNTQLQTAKELVTEIKGMVRDEVMGEVEIMVFPPFPFLTNRWKFKSSLEFIISNLVFPT